MATEGRETTVEDRLVLTNELREIVWGWAKNERLCTADMMMILTDLVCVSSMVLSAPGQGEAALALIAKEALGYIQRERQMAGTENEEQE